MINARIGVEGFVAKPFRLIRLEIPPRIRCTHLVGMTTANVVSGVARSKFEWMKSFFSTPQGSIHGLTLQLR